MSNSKLETLIWVLIYGGLLVLVLGLFVLRTSTALGSSLVTGGALGAAAGGVLVWWRSRRGP